MPEADASSKLLDGRCRIYFTSDWHIGHANVLIYDKRPFSELSHMHRVLINNYNATVGDEDLCFFLGDMGLGKGDTLRQVVSELQGKKVLILGNHDKGATAMRRIGFDVVLNMAALEIAGQIVTMTHCPLRGVWREDTAHMKGAAEGDNWHGEHKNQRFSIENFGQFHLHGHTHKGPEERMLDKQWDMGVKANNYRPVSISAVESWVASYHRRG